ncbi:MAG: NYN domain-containing protein [Candidatus Kerfeldbacteria bacterium]|nr:NYN domain-containing protein [Candidatus Kerfeldbacteria bacterium]
MKLKDQRVGVFMDVSNMYHSARNLFSARVNFGKILERAASDRQLIHATAYAIKTQSPDEQPFLEALDKAGWQVKQKELQVFSDGSKKGDWDVGLAVDTIKFASKLDVIVLVTGDGDFRPLVGYLKESHGCRVEVMGFGASSSHKIKEEADEFIDLAEDQKTFLLPIRASLRLRPRRPRFLGGKGNEHHESRSTNQGSSDAPGS